MNIPKYLVTGSNTSSVLKPNSVYARIPLECFDNEFELALLSDEEASQIKRNDCVTICVRETVECQFCRDILSHVEDSVKNIIYQLDCMNNAELLETISWLDQRVFDLQHVIEEVKNKYASRTTNSSSTTT